MLFYYILFCTFKLALTTNIVSNNPICTDMANSYIDRYPNITTPELFIITSMCEGIVHPMDSGLGGGFQAVIHKQGTTDSWYINSRERAGSNHEFASQPGKTAKHIGVPSMLKGYEHLYLNIRHYGYRHGPVLSWHDLFTKNIKLAKHGFVMSRTLSNVINLIDLSTSPWHYNTTTQKLSSPKLARWLEKLSNQKPGKLLLYKHRSSENDDIVHELREIGSSLKRSDITDYRVQSTSANSVKCLDFTMYTTKVPGSGMIQMFGCKILERLIKHYHYANWSSAKRFIYNIKIVHFMQSLQPHIKHLVHRAANSEKPLITNLINRESKLIAKFLHRYNLKLPLRPRMHFGRIKGYKSQINLTQKRDERGTSNICIKDKITTFCATSTINWSFGSCIASKNFGFFYNNQLSDFTYRNDMSHNKPTAGKQPLSSISPVIFTNSKTHKLEFAMGAAGGRKIIPSIFTMMARFIYEHEIHKRHPQRVKLYNCLRDQYISRCAFHLKPYETGMYSFLECEDTLHPVYRKTLHNYKAVVKYSMEAGYSSVTVLTKHGGCFDPRRGGKTRY